MKTQTIIVASLCALIAAGALTTLVPEVEQQPAQTLNTTDAPMKAEPMTSAAQEDAQLAQSKTYTDQQLVKNSEPVADSPAEAAFDFYEGSYDDAQFNDQTMTE